MVDLVIKNGKLVTTESIISTGIAINGERIVAIAENESLPTANRTIDAEENYVLPGIIDPHVHIGWPDWPFDQDVKATTRAAAAGGVSTIIHYIFDPGNLVEAFNRTKEIFEKNAFIDSGFHAAIFTMEQIQQISELAKLGVTSFKFTIPYRGAEAVPPLTAIDDGIVFLAFEEIAKVGSPARAMIHAENVEIFFRLKEKFIEEGKKNITWHDVRPNYSEEEAMRRCIYFAKVTNCPLYVVHMTIGEGVPLIHEARAAGIDVIAETCPQYLTLTRDEDIIMRKVNPPLRGKEDNAKLWEGIASGDIMSIGSDHASCAKKHKKEFWNAIVGMAGVETLLPIMLSEGVNKERISLQKLVEVCSVNPAKIFGLYPRKGTVQVGSDADLTIVDLEKEADIKIENLHYISDFTPYEGWKLKGWPVLTMVRGNVVMEQGKVIGEEGFGKFVPSS